MIDVVSGKRWRLAAALVAGIATAPVLTVGLAWTQPAGEIWAHLASAVLPRVLRNTSLLLASVLVATLSVGVGLAWLTAMTDMPARRFFARALLIPLAMPAYVTGFVYLGLLDFRGPVLSSLRELTGDPLTFLPSFRSPGGVVFVLTLALYPYVYAAAYTAFSTHGRHVIESARSLGADALTVFLRVALPMATPWILGSALLVAMETLADFGTVALFVFDTFTLAIYKAWFGLYSPVAAAQLASLLVVLILGLVMANARAQRRRNFAAPHAGQEQISLYPLSRKQKIAATAATSTVLTLAAAIPGAQLVVWSLNRLEAGEFDLALTERIFNSFTIGAACAGVVVVASLLLTLAQRYAPGRSTSLSNSLASLAYALPGPVLAVGFLLPMVWLDRRLVGALESWTGSTLPLLLTGSVATMILALSVRFIAVASTSLASGLRRISPRLDEAARLYGVFGIDAAFGLHVPLLRRSVIAAALLVFVDVLKEIPLTLMTRPFGWDTLSTRIFELTSEGEWQRAALPALLIVLVSIGPVALLARGLGAPLRDKELA